MPEDDLKSFTIDGIIGGLLIFSLLAFVIGFMGFNNPTGLNDGSGEILQNTYSNQSNYLAEVDDSANSLLNITANTNPEASELGSRDSVASGFSATDSAKGSWTRAKTLFSWVFTGTTGTILLGVIGGLIGLISAFLIWRWIKRG